MRPTTSTMMPIVQRMAIFDDEADDEQDKTENDHRILLLSRGDSGYADCSQEASQSLGARRGDSADVTRAAGF